MATSTASTSPATGTQVSAAAPFTSTGTAPATDGLFDLFLNELSAPLAAAIPAAAPPSIGASTGKAAIVATVVAPPGQQSFGLAAEASPVSSKHDAAPSKPNEATVPDAQLALALAKAAQEMLVPTVAQPPPFSSSPGAATSATAATEVAAPLNAAVVASGTGFVTAKPPTADTAPQLPAEPSPVQPAPAAKTAEPAATNREWTGEPSIVSLTLPTPTPATPPASVGDSREHLIGAPRAEPKYSTASASAVTGACSNPQSETEVRPEASATADQPGIELQPAQTGAPAAASAQPPQPPSTPAAATTTTPPQDQPTTSGPDDQTHPISRAAEFVAATSQDIANTSDRSAAMERPTAWSAGDSGAAISNSDRSALGEEQGDNARERRSPSDAARDPSSTQAAAAGAISAATAEHAAQSAANGSAPGSLQSRMQVIEQVASRLDAMRLSQGRQEVTLQLHPDHLGELRITIVADRDNLTARVVAQTAQARHAVEEGKDQLRSALEQKGYSLQSLDVSLSQGGAGRFQAAAQQPALPVPSRAVQSPESESVSPDLPSLVPTGASQTSDGRIDYRA